MITNYASNLVLNSMCGKTTTISIAPRAFLALSSTEPTVLGGGVTEPTDTAGYRRKQIGYAQDTYSQLMGTPSNGEITNTQEIHFDEATASWGTCSYACIYDAQTGGNLIAWGELGHYDSITGEWVAQSISPVANTVVVIKAGDLKISIT